MFGFIKKLFFIGLIILSSVNPLNGVPPNAIPLSAAPLNAIPSKSVSLTNQVCEVRLQIVSFNSDKPVFYPFCIKTSKCSGSWNNTNDSCVFLMLLKI